MAARALASLSSAEADRATIDTDFQPGHGQMLVLQIEPALALFQELGLFAGPEPILDFAGLGPDRISIIANDRNLLWPERVVRQRAQSGHQVNVWIARFIMEHPVCDLAPRQYLFDDKLPDKRDVLLLTQLDR